MEVDERQDSVLNDEVVEQPTVEQLQEELKQVKNYNNKLLDGAKSATSKFKSAREELEEIKKRDLEKNQQWEQRANDEIATNADLRKKMLKKDLDYNVAKLIDAKLAPGASIDDVVEHVLKSGVIELNDDETEFVNYENAYAKVKESKAFLFDNSRAPLTNAVPSNNAPQERKLTPEELLQGAIKTIINK